MSLRLSRGERTALETILRHQRGEARLYRRARIVLLAAAGESKAEIARQVGTNRSRVDDWIRRFEKERLDGLDDLARSGRPSKISSLERHQVVAAACKSPREFGVSREVWSHESLRDAVVETGLVREISTATVHAILDEAEIKPHRVKSWCHSTDPEFQSKMRAIVRLYSRRPRGEPVLCIDEKTGMQALSRSRDLRLPEPDRAGRFEFEYKRNGTRCLFGCFNINSGKVLGRCTVSRTRHEFLSFMDWVASVYRQKRVHIVLDNLNTHKDTRQGPFITEWNRRHGSRFRFHYTPTHGSWLNQIELWFSIVSRRVLRYGNFRSPDELVGAIEDFIETWNQHEALPFRWTYDGLPLVR